MLSVDTKGNRMQITCFSPMRKHCQFSKIFNIKSLLIAVL